MKQTNNAIKFLMAQYRAIFQNAYFKGLATAAVVTMGLAAGQAQAKALDNTGFDAITDGQTITIPTDNDSISISTAATNDNNAFTIKITSAQTVDNKIEGVTASAKKASFVIAGDGSKLTVAGASGGSGTLSIGDLKVEQGSLLLTKDTNGAKVESDTITIGKKPTNEPQPTAALAATAKVSISDGSTLGKDASVYQLYEGAQITVEEGGTLTGASLKAAGGKIIYNDNANFALKSYNENDEASKKTAQDLDIEVAATKKLSVKLAGQTAGNRGVLHFGNGSVIDLKSDNAAGGALEITADSQKSGSIVIFDQGVKLTSGMFI